MNMFFSAYLTHTVVAPRPEHTTRVLALDADFMWKLYVHRLQVSRQAVTDAPYLAHSRVVQYPNTVRSISWPVRLQKVSSMLYTSKPAAMPLIGLMTRFEFANLCGIENQPPVCCFFD